MHVVGVTMTLPTFDVVSVNIPIISFSCCTHAFNDTNIGMYVRMLAAEDYKVNYVYEVLVNILLGMLF